MSYPLSHAVVQLMTCVAAGLRLWTQGACAAVGLVDAPAAASEGASTAMPRDRFDFDQCLGRRLEVYRDRGC
jgi:hypothetical protein